MNNQYVAVCGIDALEHMSKEQMSLELIKHLDTLNPNLVISTGGWTEGPTADFVKEFAEANQLPLEDVKLTDVAALIMFWDGQSPWGKRALKGTNHLSKDNIKIIYFNNVHPINPNKD